MKTCLKIKWIGRVFILMLSIMLFSLPAMAATYTYDDLNRLIKVDYGNGKEINYTYDPAGNITSVTSSGIVLGAARPCSAVAESGESDLYGEGNKNR